MPCNLRISGKLFQVDSFLAQAQLSESVYSIHYIGDERGRNAKWGHFEDNGCSFATSHAEFDNFEQQLLDSIYFLKSNFNSLSLLTSAYIVNKIELDFGIEATFKKWIYSY